MINYDASRIGKAKSLVSKVVCEGGGCPHSCMCLRCLLSEQIEAVACEGVGVGPVRLPPGLIALDQVCLSRGRGAGGRIDPFLG